MSTTYEKLSSNKVKLAFDVAPEKFEEGIKKAYAKIVKQVNIPGFRKGKAPMKVIESHYGESVFYEDAFDAIFPEIYQEAINEYHLEPVDRPDLDVQEIGRGKNLKFTVEVFVKPDVTLGVYEDGRPGVAAVKLGKSVSIFSGAWQLDQKFISKIVDKAGAHVFSESGDPVEANDAFVMLHARFPGEKTIRLPRKATVVDVFERKLVGRDIDVIAFDAALHSTHFFYFGDDADELLAKLKRDFK